MSIRPGPCAVGRSCLLLVVAVLAAVSCSLNVLAAQSTRSKAFPADAVVDVRSYGAKGDGRTDDTAAIQKAIRENVGRTRILFFPQGTYVVSDTLAWRDAKGDWQCWLSIQGENTETTVLHLKDATFRDPNRPRPVMMTASQNPLVAEGGGNQAFGNSICDLTVDIGTANPGAIGIDYLASNKGTMENVVVRSSDPGHSGHTGVAMRRAWPGPCLLKNVEVQGFDYGIDVAQNGYVVTMEHVVLHHQRRCGLRHADSCLAVRDLRSDNTVPAVISRAGDDNRLGPAGLIVLLDSKLLGGASTAVAVENLGHLFVRNVEISGYRAAIRDRGREVASAAHGEYASQVIRGKFGGPTTSLNLPVVETPTYWDDDLSHWKSVGKPNGSDDTARIQAALDCGASTVYFPPGVYRVADTLRVRGRVRHLIGMEAELKPASSHRFTSPSDAKPVFRFETPDEDIPAVVFERFNLMGFGDGARGIENASRKDLVIKSVFSWVEGGAYRNEPGAGRLFIEDYDPGCHKNDHTIFRGQKVWARQFDPEPRLGPHVVNDGGDLWILGYKTEGFGPVLVTKNGGRTEVLGGFHYWVSEEEDQKLPPLPAYVVENGAMSASFITQRHQHWDPEPYLREVCGGATRDTRRDELPGRYGHPTNWQRAAPLLVIRAAAKQPVDYVDPLIGSGYKSTLWYYFSSACRPFGMVGVNPDMASPDWWGAGYCYHIDTIRGFGHVHDYQVGAVSVMPVVGQLDPAAGADSYSSKFSHANEVCQAGYHAVTLDRYGVRVELTSTDRVGFHRYTFPKSSHSRVIFNLSAEVVPNAVCDATVRQVSDTELAGVQVLGATMHGRRPKPCSIHFVARFDRPIGTFALCRKKVQPTSGQGATNPPKASDPIFHAFTEFTTKEGDVLQMKVGVSYVSVEQARKNLDVELPHWDFDRIRRESRETWNRWLSRIEVDGGSEQQRTKFYTDLWHVLLGRHMISDVDGKYCDTTGSKPCVRQIPLDRHGQPKYHHYNSDAFWMTFWNLNAVWGFAYPRVHSEFVNCLLDMYRNGGVLPRAMSGGNIGLEMIAAHSTPLIVGAYMKGIRDFDAELAYAGMRKNHLPGGIMGRGYFEYQSAKGGGIEDYLRYGYIPIDGRPTPSEGWPAESGSATMEYAYDDWCLAQMARALGKREDYLLFMRRAENYRNLFDVQSGFMRLRRRNGSWLTPFDPLAPGGWCEANSSVYTWFVPHDLAGLIRLLGGRDAFTHRLNRVFENSAAANFETPSVNYGNQPCTGMAHLFNYSGAPWLAQKWVYEVKTKYFGGTTPDLGYGGDEDQGQMGGLGVLMSVGLFELNGGAALDPIYEITAPIFDRVAIRLDPDYYAGGQFLLVAKRSSPAGSGPAYIQSATLNGRPLLKPWFHHRELTGGGKLEFELGTTPDKQWGNRPEDAPPSMATEPAPDRPKR